MEWAKTDSQSRAWRGAKPDFSNSRAPNGGPAFAGDLQ